MSESVEQKKDLATAYTLTRVYQSCEPLIRRIRSPREAWKTRYAILRLVSEAAIDAKLTELQAVMLKKSEHIVE